MADCYLCGAAIARGQGFRRSVVTGYSQRIYITRSSGGSVGRSTGLRTLCASCATGLDQSRQGLGLRVTVSLVVGVIGSGLALSMMKQAEGGIAVLLFFFLLGGAGLLTYVLLTWLHNANLQSPQSPVSVEPAPAPAAAASSSEAVVDTLGFQSVDDAFEGLIEQCAELGFSLLHCYEVEDTAQGRAAVLNRLLASHPRRLYEFLDDWSIAVLPGALATIQLAALYPLHQCIEARKANNDAEVARLLPSVEKMIPRQAGEAEAAYFARASGALGEAAKLKKEAERMQEISESARQS